MTTHDLALRLALPLAAVLTLASPASASSPQDQAAADVLFTEGKKLTAAGDWEHALPKFIESQRLTPTVTTLLDIGSCYEKLSKVASAYGAFRAAERTARETGDTDRQREAARRAEALAPLLPKLAIVVSLEARVPGFEVRRDGALVGEGQWGSAMPADVGNHTIEATAPGYKTWSAEIRIDVNGAAVSVRVQPLAKLAAEPAAGGTGFAWSTQRTIGLAVGGVGLVGLGVAAGFTARAASQNAASLPYCQPANPNKCKASGVDLRNQAFDASHIATGTLIGGMVAAAAGLVVFLTAPGGAPKKPKPSAAGAHILPMAAPDLAGIALLGVW